MPDMEKVIERIYDAIDYGVCVDLFMDVLELLKEQEAINPKKFKGYNPPMYTIYEYECEKCKSPMMNKQPFCMGCGRSVKW